MRSCSSKSVAVWLLALWPAIALLPSSVVVAAEVPAPVHTILNSGDPANRIDLVVLGDGYTTGELSKFARDAQTVVDGFFAQQPFRDYKRYFNIHRLDVVSSESGADHPNTDGGGTFRNTRFNATFNCSGIDRLICVDLDAVNSVLNSSLPQANRRDFALVLVNDAEYGGSGGAVAVASLHSQAVELVLHEFGHSFGLLADEYETSPPACDRSVEPPEVNVTIATQRAAIKWNHGGGPPKGWIDPQMPLPTPGSADGGVGLFEGGRYCQNGMFRPTFTSKMRELGAPYAAINEEQLILRMYNWVSPVDSATPESRDMAVGYSSRQSFRVSTPRPVGHTLKVSWVVDQVVRAQGETFQFDSAIFGSGDHTVQAIVRDPTDKVRYDGNELLTSTRTWNVKVSSAPPVGYATLNCKLRMVRRSKPEGGFEGKGTFSLGSGSNGIRPRREVVVLSLENAAGALFSQTLPGKSFRRSGPGDYRYRSKPFSSGITEMTIKKLTAPERYRFTINAERLNFKGLAPLPVTMTLQVGDDADSYTVPCTRQGKTILCS